MDKRRKIGLTTQIFISLIIGIIVGFIFNVLNNDFINTYVVSGFLQIIGKIFVNLIKMMVVPLVFISLTNGASSVKNVGQLGKIGIKTLCFYLITTAIAITLSIAISSKITFVSDKNKTQVNKILEEKSISEEKQEENILNSFETEEEKNFYQLQKKINSKIENKDKSSEKTSFKDTIIDIIPTNPVQSLAEGKMLQIILFSILLGISITMLGDEVSGVKRFFQESDKIVLKLVSLIMKIAPLGVFALITKTVSELGIDKLIPLIKYVVVVGIILLIHLTFIYLPVLFAFTKINPLSFIKRISGIMSFAFSTSSSSATIPVSIEVLEENFGVEEDVVSFTIPLGATINMDGTAIMQGVAVIFLAQFYNISLGFNDYLTVILTATLASIGTAGVPGAGTIMLALVLEEVNIPIEGVFILFGVDRLVDMMRTTINVVGDAVCTLIVAKSEKQINEEKFYSK